MEMSIALSGDELIHPVFYGGNMETLVEEWKMHLLDGGIAISHKEDGTVTILEGEETTSGKWKYDSSKKKLTYTFNYEEGDYDSNLRFYKKENFFHKKNVTC